MPQLPIFNVINMSFNAIPEIKISQKNLIDSNRSLSGPFTWHFAGWPMVAPNYIIAEMCDPCHNMPYLGVQKCDSQIVAI